MTSPTTSTDQSAIAEFIRHKGITRCPTVCVGPTQARPRTEDRQRLQEHVAAQETVRLARRAQQLAA